MASSLSCRIATARARTPCSSPQRTVINPDFGPGSLAAHRAAATAAGASYLEIGGPLTLDVDTPADLLLASAALGASNA